ncbi:hypothetical protein TNCV_58091 [Trichonephila clavipes]|nr:hypothetical protein TNCV_58091 [Trichonephila clavipes]
MCRLCSNKTEESISHECEKYVGSSGGMEPVGVYRIFERSAQMRKLQYLQFYGDKDSKFLMRLKMFMVKAASKNLNELAIFKSVLAPGFES